MSKGFYPRLAARNIIKNGRFYFPYILTVVFTSAAFYICTALSYTQNMPSKLRYEYLSAYMTVGCFVLALFIFIFLIYTNSFLMKRRVKELGLYNVLGMGKRSIGMVLSFETLYIYLMGTAAGIAVGMLLHKLVFMLAEKLMRLDIRFEFYVSLPGIAVTAVFFGGVLALTLVKNLFSLGLQKPVELLKGESVGEREPKTRWLIAIMGVLCLGAGYYLAASAGDVMTAFAVYFIAVFLVIIGTYCFFGAISIAVLKALRKNRKFYYKTGRFIGISGMLHRMNRNAVGLANICILSTMVLVMLSGTLSLYMGTEDILDVHYPASINVTAEGEEGKEIETEKLIGAVREMLEKNRVKLENVFGFSKETVIMLKVPGGYLRSDSNDRQYDDLDVREFVSFMTAEDFRAVSDASFQLESGQAICLNGSEASAVRFEFDKTEGNGSNVAEYDLVEIDNNWHSDYVNLSPSSADEEIIYVLPDRDDLVRIEEYIKGDTGYSSKVWRGFFETDGSEERICSADDWEAMWSAYFADIEGLASISISSRASQSADSYSTNGGFLFLGMFLGLVFTAAMVLIMYYKQISEGYEDRQRFAIMQQVGLEKRDIRRSINVQVLIVFFAPLVLAGIHIAFNFVIMAKLLMAFNMFNTALTAKCVLAVFGGFVMFYAAIYALTARTYYNIVSGRE